MVDVCFVVEAGIPCKRQAVPMVLRHAVCGHLQTTRALWPVWSVSLSDHSHLYTQDSNAIIAFACCHRHETRC